jgi:hypothetical protein
MKNLILFACLLCAISMFGQKPKKMVRIDMPVTINVDEYVKTVAVVYSIENDSAVLNGNFGRVFKTPIKEGMEMEREYEFYLTVDAEQRKTKHCSGCTGILPAHIRGFNTSNRQNQRDLMALREAVNRSDN